MYDEFLKKIEIYNLYYQGYVQKLNGIFDNCKEIIIPFNEFIDNDDNFKGLYINSIFPIIDQKLVAISNPKNVTLRSSAIKFIEDYFYNLSIPLTSEQIYFSHLLTVEDTLKKYDFFNACSRILKLNELIENMFLLPNHMERFYKFKPASLLFFTRKEYLVGHEYLVQHFYDCFFSIFSNTNFTKERHNFLKETAKKYIKTIDEELYKTRFEFMKTDILGTLNDFYLVDLFYQINAQCDFYYTLEDADFEKLAKFFAEKNFISNACLNKLIEIDSSYKDEYKSILLMKELKETV